MLTPSGTELYHYRLTKLTRRLMSRKFFSSILTLIHSLLAAKVQRTEGQFLRVGDVQTNERL
jgi:hypothetical protein